MQAKYKPACLKHTYCKGYSPSHEVHLSLLCHISFSTHSSILAKMASIVWSKYVKMVCV